MTRWQKIVKFLPGSLGLFIGLLFFLLWVMEPGDIGLAILGVLATLPGVLIMTRASPSRQ